MGLNGVGIKAVNALSTSFVIESVRDGQMKRVEYSCGRIVAESDIVPSSEPDGTMVCFTPTHLSSATTATATSISCR